MTHICNAIIDEASITIERGFILTANLSLNYGDSSFQGFGGYSLGGVGDAKCADHTGPNYAGEFIAKCMDIAGVEDWSQMKGKPIRVKKEHDFGSLIISIGHIIKDKWFDPKECFEILKGSSK